jgi:hypothetical protein
VKKQKNNKKEQEVSARAIKVALQERLPWLAKSFALDRFEEVALGELELEKLNKSLGTGRKDNGPKEKVIVRFFSSTGAWLGQLGTKTELRHRFSLARIFGSIYYEVSFNETVIEGIKRVNQASTSPIRYIIAEFNDDTPHLSVIRLPDDIDEWYETETERMHALALKEINAAFGTEIDIVE